ncbi:uncharacterized protein LOC124280681 isoform X2 [Haliotis rubra]|uniref:uncharacterized protein LOC124280681 isoform X2 n=1 Tax=Haliotis rubra TaxID=36100 RepID=UPI001EE60682|nr:uncharacterized protein LOC124280681 isoform X2 [Haliotis rubra]
MANCSAETERNSQALIIYVGRTGNLHQRPQSHCYGHKQAIDKHIRRTAARRLSYNFVVDPDQRCNERCYIHHITELQGRWPKFNRTRGDACTQCRRRLTR